MVSGASVRDLNSRYPLVVFGGRNSVLHGGIFWGYGRRQDRRSGMVPLHLCLLPLPSFVFDPLTCVVWASSVSIYFTLIPGHGFCLPLDLLLWFVFCWVNKFWTNGKGLLRVVGVWPAWLPPSPTAGWLGIRLMAWLSPRQNGVAGSMLLHR